MLAEAVEVVSAEVGVVPSSRVKTTGTIIEKLHRNGGHTLRSIHDLGGMRFVVVGGRDEQDRAAELIRRAFVSGSRPPRIIDRPREPVQGHRAVHVIVYPDGYPIEVQVRTEWQHRWAEWFERLADQYGRGNRYGEPPTTRTSRWSSDTRPGSQPTGYATIGAPGRIDMQAVADVDSCRLSVVNHEIQPRSVGTQASTLIRVAAPAERADGPGGSWPHSLHVRRIRNHDDRRTVRTALACDYIAPVSHASR